MPRGPLSLFLIMYALGSVFSRSGADERDTLAALNERKARLQEKIAETDRKILRTDSLARREEQRHAELRQRMKKALAGRQEDINGLNTRMEELSTEVRELSGQIEQTKSRQTAIENRREYLAGQLVRHCTALRDTIAGSLPWNREKRLARVNALRRDLETGSASIEEGLSRLLALIDEETAFGDDIVLEERPVKRNDGSTINARVLRVGNLWMVYVDAAEENYGVMRRSNDSTFVWNEDLSFAQRQDIRTAVAVKDAKKVPQIVTLPVKLNLDGEGETTNEE